MSQKSMTKEKRGSFGNFGPRTSMSNQEKANNFSQTWLKLIRYCKSYLPIIFVALAIAILGVIFQIIGPDKLKDMTNEIMNGLPAMVDGIPVINAMDFDVIFNIGMLLVCLYAASGIFSFIESFIMASVTAKISKKNA